MTRATSVKRLRHLHEPCGALNPLVILLKLGRQHSPSAGNLVTACGITSTSRLATSADRRNAYCPNVLRWRVRDSLRPTRSAAVRKALYFGYNVVIQSLLPRKMVGESKVGTLCAISCFRGSVGLHSAPQTLRVPYQAPFLPGSGDMRSPVRPPKVKFPHKHARSKSSTVTSQRHGNNQENLSLDQLSFGCGRSNASYLSRSAGN